MAGNYFWDNIKRFFYKNKALVIWTIIIAILGLATGVFCVLKADVCITCNLLQDFCLRNFFLHKYSFFAFIFIKILVYFAIFLALFLLSFLKGGNVFGLLLGFYIGFLAGIDFVVVISVCGILKGLLLGILIVLVCELALILILVLFSAQMVARNKGMRCYGRSIISGNELKIWGFYLLCCICVILVQGILLGLICKLFVF